MPLPNAKIYTTEDIYALPEGERAELIDGVIYDMAPPGRIHQKISGGLYNKIFNYISAHNGSCEVYSAPFAVFLSEERNYVEPDISVICDKDKLSDRGCEGAPDWIIEIVSPSSRRMDYAIKNTLYLSASVKEYWIIDPAKEQTTIYYYEEDAAPMIISFEQPAKSHIYKDFEIRIADLL